LDACKFIIKEIKIMDLDELKKQPYQVIPDKTLSNQDHLFKLIIIGDTGTGTQRF